MEGETRALADGRSMQQVVERCPLSAKSGRPRQCSATRGRNSIRCHRSPVPTDPSEELAPKLSAFAHTFAGLQVVCVPLKKRGGDKSMHRRRSLFSADLHPDASVQTLNYRLVGSD
jgi:hypothetical protein